MDCLLNKHGSKFNIKIPDGLRELCADITREVLREQPDEIYKFIANYIDTLFITRENTRVANKIVEQVIGNAEEILKTIEKSGLNAQRIVPVSPKLRKDFREFVGTCCNSIVCQLPMDDVTIEKVLDSTGLTLERAEDAAKIIQSAYRRYRKRIEQGEQKIPLWRKASQNTISILQKTTISLQEKITAAIIIQAAYRGYYTRNHMKFQLN